MTGIRLYPSEMTKLANLWEFHWRDCRNQGDVKIEHRSGGGIGTRTVVTCRCGVELDITDYSMW
jgi:hypothetical protein